mgnify:CR=1 FL=1
MPEIPAQGEHGREKYRNTSIAGPPPLLSAGDRWKVANGERVFGMNFGMENTGGFAEK